MRTARTIFEIYGTDAHVMTKSLMEAACVAGMIPDGSSVALKPNLVLAGTPDQGATTHAGVLSGCIEYLQEHCIRDISVIESSWIGAKTDTAMRACGYDKVCDWYGERPPDGEKRRDPLAERPHPCPRTV